MNEGSGAGLCDTCEFTRVVSSSRGSVFYLCEYSKHDPSFPKYPAIPVRVCSAYTKARENGDRRHENERAASPGSHRSGTDENRRD